MGYPHDFGNLQIFRNVLIHPYPENPRERDLSHQLLHGFLRWMTGPRIRQWASQDTPWHAMPPAVGRQKRANAWK